MVERSDLRPSGNREQVATLVTANPLVCVTRVSPHHCERLCVRTGAAGARGRRGMNGLRLSRWGRNDLRARLVLHEALQTKTTDGRRRPWNAKAGASSALEPKTLVVRPSGWRHGDQLAPAALM